MSKTNKLSWEENATKEMNNLLSNFLPISENGEVLIKYKSSIIEETEAGIEYDDDKAAGVQVLIDLNFSEPVTKPK